MSIRRVLLIIATLLTFLFVSQNLEMVEVSLLLGRPVEVPVAAIVGASFLAGFIAGIGVILDWRFRRNRKKSGEEDLEFLE